MRWDINHTRLIRKRADERPEVTPVLSYDDPALFNGKPINLTIGIPAML
jgi:hypothetical protein